MDSFEKERKHIVDLINQYNKNKYNVLMELENYIKENNIDLKNINNENFDLLNFTINSISNNNKKEGIYYDSYDNVKLINFIIKHCPYENLNYIYPRSIIQEPPLFTAISKYKFKIADYLIKQGANINYKINSNNINNNMNIINSLNKQCDDKILKYILNRNFDISNITLDLLNKLINKKENLLNIIFKHYIFDNDFILRFTSFYKNKIPLSNEKLKELIDEEKNKIYMDDCLYDTSIKWGRCNVTKTLLDYDSRDEKVILEIIYKYKLLEKAVIFSNYELMEKILSYKNLNLEKFDFEKIYTDLSCQKKDDSRQLELLTELLIKRSYDLSSINFEKVLIHTRIYGNVSILKYIIKNIILKVPSINDNHIDVTNIKNCNSTFLILILNVAIQIADINLVKCIMENEELKSKFDINNRDNDGNEAIMVALYSPVSNYFNGKRQIKCDEIFKYLLENGVNCNKKDKYNNFLLTDVIYSGNYMMIKYFLKQNLIIEKSSIDNNYSPLLRESIYQNRVVDFESLMQHNEFNKIDNSISIQKNVFTPLVFAYLSNYTDIFKILLEKTDINEKDGFKNTLLFYAILKEDIPTIEYLIKNNVDINFEDKFSNSALDISLKINNIKIFNMILNHRNLKLYTINSQLETPFSVIIKSRYYNIEKKLSMIKSLIDKGFDLNKPDGYRKSALAYSIEENLLPIIKLLIENRANVNFVGGNGNSPLGYAIQKKSLPIVKLLVNNGAKINCLINDTNTSMRYEDNMKLLLYAIKMDDLEIIKFLIEHSSNTDFEDVNFCFSLMDSINKNIIFELFDYFKICNIAIFKSDLLKLLIQKCKLNLLKIIIPKYVDSNLKDEDGNTLLANSVIASNFQLVNYLVRCGANLHSRNHKNETINDINKNYNFKYNTEIYEKIKKIIEKN